MTNDEKRVAKILSDCQKMLKSNGNENEIRRQLTIAKHILSIPLIMQDSEDSFHIRLQKELAQCLNQQDTLQTLLNLLATMITTKSPT